MLRKFYTRILAIFLIVAFGVSFHSFCFADITRYRSDSTFSGQSSETLKPPLRTEWVELIGATNSSPIIMGDKLFIATTWGLVCYNAKWGTIIWQFCTKDFHNSSPFYHNETIYAGHTNAMYAVEAQTGYQKWKFETEEGQINSSPIVHQNHVYFASGKKLLCLNADTGEKVWDILFGQQIRLPVAFDTERFYVAAEDRIYTFSIQNHQKLWEYELINDILHGFCINGDRLICPVDDTLFCIDTKTGKQVWKTFYPNYNAMNPPSYYEDNIYVAFDQFLFSVDVKTGNLNWQFEAGFFIESAPVISKDYIWIGSDDFIIYCLDRRTGHPLYFTSAGTTSKYLVLSNDRIFSVSSYGELFSFVHDATERRGYVVFEMWVGKKYVRDNDRTYAIDAPPFVEEGRTMVPIRPIGDALGAEVTWYPDDKRIAYSLKTQYIQMKVGEIRAYINGKVTTMDVPPIIRDSRAYVPLRFVGEKLGAKVEWEPKEKKITLRYP
jgi:outer membrane protein assembly factor BamB